MGRKKRKQEEANQNEVIKTQQEAAGAISAYRPHQQQAYNEGLQQIMGMFQGTNNFMADAYGDKATQMEGEQMGGLISPAMMGVGATSQAPGYAEGTPGLEDPTPENERGLRVIEGVATDPYQKPHEQMFPEQVGPSGGTGQGK